MPLPSVQDIVFKHLVEERDKREARPSVLEGIHSRVSSAGRCARAIGFQISGVEPSDPPTADSMFNFYLGDQIHDVVQRAIIAQWPDAQTETLGTIGDFLEGHSDVLYSAEDNQRVVCEIKSIADFAFMKATGIPLKSNGRWHKKDEPAEGPKREHLLQAGIYGLMHGAKYLAIVYVRKTATKDEPIIAEWRFVIDEHADAAKAEIERHRKIVEMLRARVMPDREFEGQIIPDPGKARWPCGYCSYKQSCIELGSGEVEIV